MSKPSNTVFNNFKQTLGKAVLQGRLSSIVRRMDHARDAYKTSHKTTKDAHTGKTSLTLFQEDMAAAQAELEALLRELSENLATETTIHKEYTPELMFGSINETLQVVQKQFAHQPNICATLQMFVLLLEQKILFNVNFSHMRTQCGVEDRKINNSSYDLTGEPNAKGRNECDHCPHKV